MDRSEWYIIAVGAIAAAFFCQWLLRMAPELVRKYLPFTFWRRLVPSQFRRHLGSGTKNRFDIVLALAFLIGNILCLLIGGTDRLKILQLSGLLFTANIIPLALGSRMNFVVDFIGLELEHYGQMHCWIGWVAIIEGVLHVTLALLSQGLDTKSIPQIAALSAAIATLAIFITSSAFIRRYCYETFLWSHRVLALAIIIAISIHAPSTLITPPTIYLIVSGSLWVAVRILRLAYTLFRSLRKGGHSCRATILPCGGDKAVQVHIKLSRSWEFEAGQFLYLCIPAPAISLGAWAQSHPYFVSWWFINSEGEQIVVLIVESRRGFSKSLTSHSHKDDSPPKLWRAFIEGPFGHGIRLDDYGTVILLATGIGIAGQLPYIKQLLHAYSNHEIKAREISLFWEVESESHSEWIGNWMTELLKEDKNKVLVATPFLNSTFAKSQILKLYVSIVGHYTTKGAEKGSWGQAGERIKLTFDAIDVNDEDIRSVLKHRKGRTVISLSVRESIGRKVRMLAREIMDGSAEDIDLKELPFHPSRSRVN